MLAQYRASKLSRSNTYLLVWLLCWSIEHIYIVSGQQHKNMAYGSKPV